MPGWRSHEEIIAWQLASELKKQVYALIDADPRIQRDVRFAIVPLQRLCKRASKAATGLIAYLKTAQPPNEEPRRRRTSGRTEPKNPREPLEQKPPEPSEPSEPMEPMD